MQIERNNKEVTVILLKNSCEQFTSEFKTDEIERFCGDTQRIWIGI